MGVINKIWKGISRKKGNNKITIEDSDYAIDVRDFFKKFGQTISVNNISFQVKKGSIHGFIGPNGSGKTTTIKALIGAYVVEKGVLKVNNFKAGSTNANKLVGYIPERASFPKHLNCIEYLKAMAEMSGLKSKDATKKATEILENLKMTKHAKRKPIAFSSGMQKKILLAQALITNPKILILDEPAANLDPDARKELFDEIIELRNRGKTIFISSHIMSELERIIDEVTFLYYGNIIFSGKVNDFLQLFSCIFIKTSNNEKLVEFFKAKKIKYIGDTKNELGIIGIDVNKSQKILEEIKKLELKVISFRTNDLQLAYSLAVKEREAKANANI